MAWVQRNESGDIVAVARIKQDWTPEELPDDHPDLVAIENKAVAYEARRRRDGVLAGTDWIISRHRDQKDAGTPTTLSYEQFTALLSYRQALRDWADQPGFPNNPLPTPPALT